MEITTQLPGSIDQNGKPWFIAKDVCDVLGLSNTALALRPLEANEKSYVNRINFGLAPGRPMVIINKQGLQRLLMRSDKPEAKKFQDWVTKDVLPAIRKDGGYVVGEERMITGEMSEDELLLKAMNILATVTTDNKCYFSPRHVCEALGISWPRQFTKIMEDQVLASSVAEMATTALDGKSQYVKIMADPVLSTTVKEILTVALDGKTCVTAMVMQLPPRKVLFKKSESPYIVER